MSHPPEVSTSIFRRRIARMIKPEHRQAFLSAGMSQDSLELFHDAHLNAAEMLGSLTETTGDNRFAQNASAFFQPMMLEAGPDFACSLALIMDGYRALYYDEMILADTENANTVFDGMRPKKYEAPDDGRRGILEVVAADALKHLPDVKYGISHATVMFDAIVRLTAERETAYMLCHHNRTFTLIVQRGDNFSRFIHAYGDLLDQWMRVNHPRNYEAPIFMAGAPPMMVDELNETELLRFTAESLELGRAHGLDLSLCLHDNTVAITLATGSHTAEYILEACPIDGSNRFNLWVHPNHIQLLACELDFIGADNTSFKDRI